MGLIFWTWLSDYVTGCPPHSGDQPATPSVSAAQILSTSTSSLPWSPLAVGLALLLTLLSTATVVEELPLHVCSVEGGLANWAMVCWMYTLPTFRSASAWYHGLAALAKGGSGILARCISQSKDLRHSDSRCRGWAMPQEGQVPDGQNRVLRLRTWHGWESRNLSQQFFKP